MNVCGDPEGGGPASFLFFSHLNLNLFILELFSQCKNHHTQLNHHTRANWLRCKSARVTTLRDRCVGAFDVLGRLTREAYYLQYNDTSTSSYNRWL